MKKLLFYFLIISILFACKPLKPKVKILSIESKGCHYCEEQQKIFEELKQIYKDKIIIETHLIDDPDGLTYADKYGASKFPTNIFLDEKGNILFRADGLLKKETIVKVLNVIGVK